MFTSVICLYYFGTCIEACGFRSPCAKEEFENDLVLKYILRQNCSLHLDIWFHVFDVEMSKQKLTWIVINFIKNMRHFQVLVSVIQDVKMFIRPSKTSIFGHMWSWGAFGLALIHIGLISSCYNYLTIIICNSKLLLLARSGMQIWIYFFDI